jgi:hypothetical protein
MYNFDIKVSEKNDLILLFIEGICHLLALQISDFEIVN